jgi:hypothetical protein
LGAGQGKTAYFGGVQNPQAAHAGKTFDDGVYAEFFFRTLLSVFKLQWNSVSSLGSGLRLEQESTMTFSKFSARLLLVCLLKGCFFLLRFFAKRHRCSYTSTFMPDVFTNSEQFRKTVYYEYGNEYKFCIQFNQLSCCLFFSTENSKDLLMLRNVMGMHLFLLSFSADPEISSKSDLSFPIEIIDLRGLYGALVFVLLLTN